MMKLQNEIMEIIVTRLPSAEVGFNILLQILIDSKLFM